MENFILHRAQRSRDTQRTDIDVIAVRFPFSREILGNRRLTDDDRILDKDAVTDKLIDFLIVEVKSGSGALNRIWSRPTRDNLDSVEYVLRRMGFIEEEYEIANAARSLHTELRVRINPNHLVRVVAFADRPGSVEDDSRVHFVAFGDIARFIARRQWKVASDHDQWDADIKCLWAAARELRDQEEEFVDAVRRWVETG